MSVAIFGPLYQLAPRISLCSCGLRQPVIGSRVAPALRPTDLPAKTAPWLTVGINEMTDIVVAERVFRDSNSGASVTAQIFVPQRDEDSSDWSCKICIEGLATPFERSIFGIDSFQALELATSLLCTVLESHEASLAFLDGSPGDCALPLIAGCPPSLKAEVRAFIRTRIKDDLESGQRRAD